MTDTDTAAREALQAKRNELHIYEPHKANFPPMRPYVRDLWARRRFAYELSRTGQRSGFLDSPLGALWLVLNPLLLAFVYYLLVLVLSSQSKTAFPGAGITTFMHIIVGLFTWYYSQNCMTIGATSITMGGRLILNQSFPRTLLPMSALISAFLQYWPTLPVTVAFYVGFNVIDPQLQGLTWPMLLLPVLFVIQTVQNMGLAMIFGTMQVYFRDTTKFLSYILRIWLYLSPVLWFPERFIGHSFQWILYLNPLGPVVGSVTQIWINGEWPRASFILASVVWAIVTLLIGAWVFVTRERDFAVRL